MESFDLNETCGSWMGAEGSPGSLFLSCPLLHLQGAWRWDEDVPTAAE